MSRRLTGCMIWSQIYTNCMNEKDHKPKKNECKYYLNILKGNACPQAYNKRVADYDHILDDNKPQAISER